MYCPVRPCTAFWSSYCPIVHPQQQPTHPPTPYAVTKSATNHWGDCSSNRSSSLPTVGHSLPKGYYVPQKVSQGRSPPPSSLGFGQSVRRVSREATYDWVCSPQSHYSGITAPYYDWWIPHNRIHNRITAPHYVSFLPASPLSSLCFSLPFSRKNHSTLSIPL